MATNKGGGSTRNGRDSNPQYLGVKAYGGETVKAGSILIPERGTKFFPGFNVGLGKDHTLFARITGIVKFERGQLVANPEGQAVSSSGRPRALVATDIDLFLRGVPVGPGQTYRAVATRLPEGRGSLVGPVLPVKLPTPRSSGQTSDPRQTR